MKCTCSAAIVKINLGMRLIVRFQISRGDNTSKMSFCCTTRYWKMYCNTFLPNTAHTVCNAPAVSASGLFFLFYLVFCWLLLNDSALLNFVLPRFCHQPSPPLCSDYYSIYRHSFLSVHSCSVTHEDNRLSNIDSSSVICASELNNECVALLLISTHQGLPQ